MAGTFCGSVSISAVFIQLMALSSLVVPTMAVSTPTSTCPAGFHPVLAAGSGSEWYGVCCPPQATVVAALTSSGPRCCTQPTTSDSLNLVPVSEWSTCNVVPVSAESCVGGRNEQVWNDFKTQICREADSPHSLFPPSSASDTEVEAEAEPRKAAQANVNNTVSLLPRQGTAICPLGYTVVPAPDPNLFKPARLVCCNPLYNEAAVQHANGIFCCLNGGSTCDQPAVSVLSCPGANVINLQPFNLLVCLDRTKRSEERDEPQPLPWCATHNDPNICLRDSIPDAHSETDDAIEKRSECHIAPENGNCKNGGSRSLPCPPLVTLLSIVIVILTIFTSPAAADAAGTTTCPANAKTVSTIAIRDDQKDTYIVCCPDNAADMAAINFSAGKVNCCFGPLCDYSSVDVERCAGGSDNMLSVGYEVGGTTICLATGEEQRSSVVKPRSDIAPYGICPSGYQSIAAHYPEEEGSYLACCPDDYNDRAYITNSGKDHVYCCDSVDCNGIAENVSCADGATPVEIKGDHVTVCRIDEIQKRTAAFTMNEMEFKKRKGGSHTSAAARGLSLPSPFILLTTTILALAFVITPAAADEAIIMRCPAKYDWVPATANGMNGKHYKNGPKSAERYFACCPQPVDVQKDLALIDRPNKKIMCCAPGGDCSKTPSKAVCMSQCSWKVGTEKVDLFGDGVDLCKIDTSKIGTALEKAQTETTLEKRKGGRGGGGGGCGWNCSAASHSHNLPSSLLLIAPALLALVSSLTKAVAASGDLEREAGEDSQTSELGCCPDGSHPAYEDCRP